VTRVELGRSPEDAQFIRAVLEVLGEVKSEAGVIAGELSAYDIPELREAAVNALKRGVDITVYANEPPKEATNEIRSLRGRLKVGSLKARHHYFIADGRHVIISRKVEDAGPTERGSRDPVVCRDEPALARAVQSYLTFLDDAATGVDPARVIGDLLDASTRNPTIVREIPIGENVLTLAGLDAPEARLFVAELRSRFAAWSGSETAEPEASKLAEIFANATCLYMALTAAGGVRSLVGNGDMGSMDETGAKQPTHLHQDAEQ
jgi:hypothetical protein